MTKPNTCTHASACSAPMRRVERLSQAADVPHASAAPSAAAMTSIRGGSRGPCSREQPMQRAARAAAVGPAQATVGCSMWAPTSRAISTNVSEARER